MGLFHGTHKIDDGQEREDQRLYETHQNPQKQYWQRGEIEACQHKKDPKNGLFAKDVAKKSDTQWHNTGKMTDKLNRKHQWGQPPYRSEKVLNIFDAMEFESNYVRYNKCAQCHRQGGIEIRSRREKAGEQSDQIGNEYVKENSSDEWEEKSSFGTGYLNHKVFESTNNDL